MFYCDASCQRQDWAAAHKFAECEFYSRISCSGEIFKYDTDRFLLRLFLKNNYDAEACNRTLETISGGASRGLADLMDHKRDLKADPVRLRQFYAIGERFKRLGVKFNEEDLLSLFGKLMVNGFQITDNCFRILGVGLYIQISCLDHSCRPNCAAVFEGVRMQVRAINNINTQQQTILIHYVDLKEEKESRREKLRRRYYFDCNCERCDSRFDDEINFECLKELDNLQNQLTIEGLKWREVFLLGLKSLPLYTKIFGDYHPVLTVQQMRILQALAFSNLLSEEDMETNNRHQKQITERCLEAIAVTHGLNHSIFQKDFQQILSTK